MAVALQERMKDKASDQMSGEDSLNASAWAL